MIKKILVMAVFSMALACKIQKNKPISEANVEEYASTITAAELKDHLYTFASDEFQGRDTGKPGQKKAANYLKDNYMKMEIASPLGGEDYFQDIPSSFFNNKYNDSENVVAFIKGSEFPEEIVVISAHYDHVGMDAEGNIYNGADDDGSGTVSILEIAEAFKEAQDDGYQPRRSILFLHVTGEEKGLLGSDYYTKNPIFPLENTVTDLNTDMIGRIDPKHEDNPNYIYLIGSDKLSTQLHELSEEVNNKYTQFDLDYTYNDENDPNRFYYRSDHYNFAKHNIPVIFYFNGTHADYHQPTDTPDKIEYDLMARRAQLIFYTAWEVANRDERLVVDKAQ
ncbi:M28 family metallopeptidase [Mesonia mobilis]|uniref:Peptidase M28 n=2 Tax=Mesonia mobilis TaxID=369791 RepID=A0ABQ3BUV4_9FLAO|nr:M28 family metallopeptidase [Mesonia mobilis]MBQ0736608.1 M28 family peptidase [Aquimarina celericrescens]GGZ58299.1 peptidase M28 [Mesonia mobilis]